MPGRSAARRAPAARYAKALRVRDQLLVLLAAQAGTAVWLRLSRNFTAG